MRRIRGRISGRADEADHITFSNSQTFDHVRRVTHQMRVIVNIASARVRDIDGYSSGSPVRQLDDASIRSCENGRPSHCHYVGRHVDSPAASWLVKRVGELPRLSPFHRHHQRMRAEICRVGWKHRPHVQTHRRVGPRSRNHHRRQFPRARVAGRAQVHARRAADNGAEESGTDARDTSDTIASRAKVLELSSLKHQLGVVRAPAASLPPPPAPLPSSRFPPRSFSSGASSRIWDRTSRRTPRS